VSSELQPRRRTARATARGLAAGGRARRTREGAKVEAGAAGQEHWSRRRSWDSRTGAGAGVQPSRTRLAEQLAAASRCAWARDRTRSPGRGWRRRRGGWRLALAGWLLGFCSGLRENFVFFLGLRAPGRGPGGHGRRSAPGGKAGICPHNPN
jgi:hypothetical protein